MATVDKDKEFEPTVEMMVDDFDDERTLEEEERLAAMEQQDPDEELSSLQKEGDMPIEELLALYYNKPPDKDEKEDTLDEDSESEEKEVGESVNENIKTEEQTETDKTEQNSENAEEEEEEEESDLKKLYPETYSPNTAAKQKTSSSRPQSEESDNDYEPEDDDIKKTIMVGSDFQAQIPEEFSKYDDALPYENKDKLVWEPKLAEDEIIDYLQKSIQCTSPVATNSNVKQQLAVIPTGKHLRDDEQALFLLQQCGHNVEEALRRRRISAVPPPIESMSAWSEEECRNFETGIRMYGKDFHQIQLSKVRTRSVGELVQFYYLWKKTERHDVFASKARLDKKKYSLNPGLTDHMDRFLEDQEGTSFNGLNGAQLRDRSSSAGVNSLLYADIKRQRLEKHHGANTDNFQSDNKSES